MMGANAIKAECGTQKRANERERELCGGEVEVTAAWGRGERHAAAKQSLIYARRCLPS